MARADSTPFTTAEPVVLDTGEVAIDQQAPLFQLIDTIQQRAWAQ